MKNEQRSDQIERKSARAATVCLRSSLKHHTSGTQMNTNEHKWTQVNTNTTQMNTSEHKWTRVNTSEHEWTQVNTSEHKWTQVKTMNTSEQVIF